MAAKRDTEILAGLYLGTSKISVVVAELSETAPNEAHIIGIGEAPANGLRKGMIVNLEQAVNSISDAVADAEYMLSGIKVSRVVVAFSGVDVRSGIVYGKNSLGAKPRQIVQEDVEKAIDNALSALDIPKEYCIVHLVPIKYALDGNKDIDDPLGMTGIRLEVKLMAVIAPVSVVHNVVNCVERTGISVSGLILKPVAAALGALNIDERNIGAYIVSVGGGMTSLAEFSDGALVRVAEIPIGGDHVTNDLSCVLKIPFNAAENIKKDIDLTPEAEHSGIVRVESRGRTLELERSEIAEIAENRLDELFADYVRPNLAGGGEEDEEISSDVVLSGGVALMKGIEAFAASRLNASVRVGEPVLKSQMQPGRNDARYIGVCGIIVYIMERLRNPFAYAETPLSLFEGSGSSFSTGEQSGQRRRTSPAEFMKKITDSVVELIKELF